MALSAISQLERVMEEIATGEVSLSEARTAALELLVSLSRAAMEAGASPSEVYELLWGAVRRLLEAAFVSDVRSILDETAPLILAMLPFEDLKSNKEKVGRAIEYINRNYHRRLSLAEVSQKAAFMTPSHFCRLFKRFTGMTFVEFVNRTRVEAAKALLKGNSAPVKEISSMVGFASPQYFARVFKRHTGLSPLQYRRLHSRREGMKRGSK